MAFSSISSLAQQFSIATNFFGVNRNTYSASGQFYQTPFSGHTAEYTTIGPNRNEVMTTYSYNQGTHHIRFLAYVSPDILLVHQSKMAGFYRVMSSNKALEPFSRLVKDQLLKDTNMRIRTGDQIATNSSGKALAAVASATSGY